MIQTGLIPNAHSDLVTDASYDFYGLRLATCSLDQRLKIWQLDESTGTWNLEHDWKAHDAAISNVSWAHPEFGTILATASFDRTVKVWEQTVAPDADGTQLNGPSAAPSTSSTRWVERAMLVDAKGTVRAVEFAPQHFGLKLVRSPSLPFAGCAADTGQPRVQATISSDNCLRIYECLEQPSLAAWQLLEEVDVLSLPATSPAPRSLSQTLTMATPTQPSATLDGNSVSLVAHALQQQASQNQLPGRPGLGTREADGGWCISWCKDKYWGEIVAAGCGIDGIVKIVQISPSRRPSTLLSLNPSPTTSADPSSTTSKSTAQATSSNGAPAAEGSDGPKTFAVTSIAWAPSCGRSYHLVATGGRDGHVRIWRVKPPTPSDDLDGEADADGGVGTGSGDAGRWSASIVGDFDDHKSAVGRVEWNVTGTVLSSAGNDGRVRLWKMTAGNVWRPAGHISVEQAEEQQGDVDMGDVTAED
ncbi:WD40 repeat-like protein [Pilatotrama ljubarskyi]|nr:WD40 repeat-like protein [Pilatotrama ljubarskyi]